MKHEIMEENVILYLEGSISSSNAEDVQKKIDEIKADKSDKEIVIDAEELTYISSAGLRVLMKTAKAQNNSLTIMNVSNDVYDIFDVTGFTTIFNIRKKLRELSVEGCVVIGKGANGTVYRIDDDTIIKVFPPNFDVAMIEDEQKRAKKAFLLGIPTAISYDVVKVGDRYGSVFEMLKAINYNDYVIDNPDRKDELIREYAHLVREVNKVMMPEGELPTAREEFVKYVEEMKDIFSKELYEKLRDLFAALPDPLNTVHGDIQMKNVMVVGEEPLLIDMESLCTGDPVFELQGLFLTYMAFNEDEPDNTLKFMDVPKDLADEIFNKTVEYYFDDRDDVSIEDAKNKIKLVGCLHFLRFMVIKGVGRDDLRQIRTEHMLKHLNDLAMKVDNLSIL